MQKQQAIKNWSRGRPGNEASYGQSTNYTRMKWKPVNLLCMLNSSEPATHREIHVHKVFDILVLQLETSK